MIPRLLLRALAVSVVVALPVGLHYAVAPAVAVAASYRVLSPTLTVTISMPSTQPWVDTGIDLGVGDVVSITATGTMTPCGGCGVVTPAGVGSPVAPESALAPGGRLYSIVQRVGNGIPTYVGTGAVFHVRIPGRLGLGINDSVFSDNQGSYTATISVWA